MAKKVYRIEIIREYDSQKEAIKAARDAFRYGKRDVTLYEDTKSSGGQPVHRDVVWRNGAFTARPQTTLYGP